MSDIPDLLRVALEYYRDPNSYPALTDPDIPLPAGISELLAAHKNCLSEENIEATAAELKAPLEDLLPAVRFLVKQAMLRAGGDAYRVLGVPHDASMIMVRSHYGNLISLFHPDRDASGEGWDQLYAPLINESYQLVKADHPGEVTPPDLDKEPRDGFSPSVLAAGAKSANASEAGTESTETAQKDEEENVHSKASKKKRVKQPRPTRKWVAIGAGILILAVGSGLYFFSMEPDNPSTDEVAVKARTNSPNQDSLAPPDTIDAPAPPEAIPASDILPEPLTEPATTTLSPPSTDLSTTDSARSPYEPQSAPPESTKLAASAEHTVNVLPAPQPDDEAETIARAVAAAKAAATRPSANTLVATDNSNPKPRLSTTIPREYMGREELQAFKDSLPKPQSQNIAPLTGFTPTLASERRLANLVLQLSDAVESGEPDRVKALLTADFTPQSTDSSLTGDLAGYLSQTRVEKFAYQRIEWRERVDSEPFWTARANVLLVTRREAAAETRREAIELELDIRQQQNALRISRMERQP